MQQSCTDTTKNVKLSYMPKLPKLYTTEGGTIQITDGTKIIGGLLPVLNRHNRYTVRMGTSGGFYNTQLSFDDALAFLMERLKRSYERELRSIQRGANLIHKKKKSSLIMG